MWRSAKRRALSRGWDFNIEVTDIRVPSHCPVLGIPLFIGKGKPTDNSPSLDRIKPEWGYIKGNILVVSHRVNKIKSDATLSEIQAIADFYRV